METVIAIGALAAAGYLMATSDETHAIPRKGRLADYYVQGSTFEDISTALKSGYRLIELNVYSDAQDQPVVSLKPAYDGVATRSFESACVDIVNDAFPSKDPLILSLALHTDKSFTLNRVAYHLKTTVRKHFTTEQVEKIPLDLLGNSIIIVSGNEARGTELEPLLNLSWNESKLRRLTYQQAAYPREPSELRAFTKDNIVIVAPDQSFSKVKVMDDVYGYGCQWNLCSSPLGQPGFIPRE
jgi:hypothetical protein